MRAPPDAMLVRTLNNADIQTNAGSDSENYSKQRVPSQYVILKLKLPMLLLTSTASIQSARQRRHEKPKGTRQQTCLATSTMTTSPRNHQRTPLSAFCKKRNPETTVSTQLRQ